MPIRHTICVSVWLARDMKTALLRIANKRGVTLSRVIIWALTEYLRREE